MAAPASPVSAPASPVAAPASPVAAPASPVADPVIRDEEYSRFFTEGQGDDTDFSDGDFRRNTEVDRPTILWPVRDVIDRDMPDDLQINESELSDSIKYGEIKSPNDLGLDMSKDGVKITGIEEGNYILEDGRKIAYDPNNPLLGIDVSPSKDIPSSVAIGTDEQIDFLRNLVTNNYAKIKC